jgi:hypothetical protein
MSIYFPELLPPVLRSAFFHAIPYIFHFLTILTSLLKSRWNHSRLTSTFNWSPIRLSPSSTVCSDTWVGISTTIVMM